MADQKLADWQVIELIHRWDSGDWTLVELEEAYGVRAPTIYRYATRKSPRARKLCPLPQATDGLQFSRPDGRAQEHPTDHTGDAPRDPWAKTRASEVKNNHVSQYRRSHSFAPQQLEKGP